MKRIMFVLTFLLLVVGNVMAQGRKVTGVVTDATDGKPLPGVRVFVNKTAVGTVTDTKGVFQLTVPEQYKMLTISSIGYQTQEVPVSATINVKLQFNEKRLNEAIVVAYGVAKKSAFTGSATDVKSEEISQHVTANAVNAVVGKVAGLQSAAPSGEPGKAPAIRLRGIGSMSASSAPLYIVDGAPTEFGIDNINPQDIESISIQKDAAASAIYGARGANGVIIITTKKAKSGQPAKVTLDAKWGSNSRLVPQYDVISDPAQYYETFYRALYNSQIYHGKTSAEAYAYANKYLFDSKNGGLGYQIYTVPNGENLIGSNFKLNPNATLGYCDGTYTYRPDDWYNEVFHNSFRQEYNLSVSGSEGKLNYYTSVGYLNDGGFLDNSRYQRYTARTNVDYKVRDWLKVSTNMGFTHTDTELPSFNADVWAGASNVFYTANTIAPIFPLYVRDAQGNIMMNNGRVIYDANQTNFVRPSFLGNAVRDNAYNSRKRYTDMFSGQWQAVLTPIEGLSLTANLSAQTYNHRKSNLYSCYASATDGGVSLEHKRTFAINQQYLANYIKTVNSVHNFSFLAGYEQYKVKEQYLNGMNDHLYNPTIGELDNALGSEAILAGSHTDNLMREGFLARVLYDFDNKYFGSASIRRDASSKFAPGHRWGTFGSIGGAWQMNKEAFMKEITWVDLLKLKLSYGVQGNDAGMDYYAYADRYKTFYNSSTGEYSIAMTQKGNDNLTWESNHEVNFGVEFQLFKGRLDGSVELYSRKTSDLLYDKTLPLSSGISVETYPVNVGSMVNRGIEFSLNGVAYRDKNIQWDLNFNLTHNHNEITELDPSVAKNGIKRMNYILREGGSYIQAYMLKYAGTDKSTGQGLYYKDVVDENGKVTGITTTTDMTQATQYDLGCTLPDVYGGFGTTLKGFGFDLSMQFAFQLGGRIYDGQYQALMNNGLAPGHAMHKDLLKAWSTENPNSDIPRLSNAKVDDIGFDSQTPMDRFLESSDYLSLNNVSLGYTLPKNLVKSIKLEKVRVYIAGENLFLLTARKGLDPRFASFTKNNTMAYGSGLASSGFSTMRSVTAGVTITF